MGKVFSDLIVLILVIHRSKLFLTSKILSCNNYISRYPTGLRRRIVIFFNAKGKRR